jgi:hypothetical protein
MRKPNILNWIGFFVFALAFLDYHNFLINVPMIEPPTQMYMMAGASVVAFWFAVGMMRWLGLIIFLLAFALAMGWIQLTLGFMISWVSVMLTGYLMMFLNGR